MKRNASYLITPLLCLCMAVSVSCHKDTDPMTEQKQLVTDQLTALYQGDIDGFMSQADYGDFDLTDSVRYNAVKETLKAFIKGFISTNGGFSRIEATSAEMNPDSTVTVYYDLYFNNGQAESHSQKVTCTDGVWKLRVKE